MKMSNIKEILSNTNLDVVKFSIFTGYICLVNFISIISFICKLFDKKGDKLFRLITHFICWFIFNVAMIFIFVKQCYDFFV